VIQTPDSVILRSYPPMALITRALTFLRGLVQRPHRPVCPHCGSTVPWLIVIHFTQ